MTTDLSKNTVYIMYMYHDSNPAIHNKDQCSLYTFEVRVTMTWLPSKNQRVKQPQLGSQHRSSQYEYVSSLIFSSNHFCTGLFLYYIYIFNTTSQMLNHYHHTFTHKPFSSFHLILSHFKSVYSFKCITETIQAKVENAAPFIFYCKFGQFSVAKWPESHSHNLQ